MATITLKNVPDSLHARLKALAKAHKRSLNQEALVCIEEATLSEWPRPEKVLIRARELRSRIAAGNTRPLTQKFLRQAVDEGRE